MPRSDGRSAPEILRDVRLGCTSYGPDHARLGTVHGWSAPSQCTGYSKGRRGVLRNVVVMGATTDQ